MTGLIGPIIGGLGSIAAGFYGSSQADKAKKSGKKAAKRQQALGREFVKTSEGQYGTDLARQGEVLAAQKAAATAAYGQQNRLLQAGQAREAAAIQGQMGRATEAFQPYTDYGRTATGALSGLFGESPEAAAGFVDRWTRSPLYTQNYENMVKEGEDAIAASGAARGGLNTGRQALAISENAGDVTNRLLPQYVQWAQEGQGIGLNAAGQLVDAQGNLVQQGVQSSQFATTGGANAAQNQAQALRADQGAYGTNTMQLGQNRLSNIGAGMGVQAQGYANQAANAAAAAQAKTKAWTGAAEGVATAFGAGAGGNPGANPYNMFRPGTGGPTNIIPAGY